MRKTTIFSAFALVLIAAAGLYAQDDQSGEPAPNRLRIAPKVAPRVRAVLHAAAAPGAPTTGPEKAVAVLISTGDSGVTGTVYFTKAGDSVHVTGKVTGLKPGEHGFHVHQFGDVTGSKDGLTTGGHFNPEGKDHGKPEDKVRHVGDLGNIKADDKGVAEIDIKDSLLELSGPHSILGRGLVVHANADKFVQPTGDAGGRVAVGVIGIAEVKPVPK
jgi:superoxide dismutase, Cu-Zn family